MLIPNCYFCHKMLSKFYDKENSGNYNNHYVCYNCPQYTDKPGIASIWGPPYCVIVENGEIRVTYFYLPNIELHISVFHFDRPFIDFRTRALDHILRLEETDFDIWKYTPEELDTKMKMWLTFS